MTSVTAQRDGHHDRCVMADADRFLRVCYLDRVQVCANEIKSEAQSGGPTCSFQAFSRLCTGERFVYDVKLRLPQGSPAT